jgi:hypothetical protein
MYLLGIRYGPMTQVRHKNKWTKQVENMWAEQSFKNEYVECLPTDKKEWKDQVKLFIRHRPCQI